MNRKDLARFAWDAAVNEAANVQEKGFKYQPLTFEQWWDKQDVYVIEGMTYTGGEILGNPATYDPKWKEEWDNKIIE